MNPEDIAVNLVKLNSGRVVGRTRLQKVAYLLDRSGAEFGLPFTYHHYGPYSFELADGWADARAEGRVHIAEQLGRHGVSYSIFTLDESENSPDDCGDLGELSASDAREQLKKMAPVSNVVLELAATIVYLKENGYGGGTIEELKVRKPLKATDELVRKALCLLESLGLGQEV